MGNGQLNDGVRQIFLTNVSLLKTPEDYLIDPRSGVRSRTLIHPLREDKQFCGGGGEVGGGLVGEDFKRIESFPLSISL